MLIQNNPIKDKILEKSELDVSDYLMLSQDFCFKSQIIRSFEMNANNSLKVLFENIFKLNRQEYGTLIEYDLCEIMKSRQIN